MAMNDNERHVTNVFLACVTIVILVGAFFSCATERRMCIALTGTWEQTNDCLANLAAARCAEVDDGRP